MSAECAARPYEATSNTRLFYDAVPVRALMKEGYDFTFANPKGNAPQMDVHSAVADFFGGDEAKLQDYLKFRDTLTGLENPTRSRMSSPRAWINMTLFSSPAAMAR